MLIAANASRLRIQVIIANAGRILQTPRVFRERTHRQAMCIAAFICQHAARIRVGTGCPPYGIRHWPWFYNPNAAFIKSNTRVFSIVPLNGAEPAPAAYSFTSPPPCDSLDQRIPVSW